MENIPYVLPELPYGYADLEPYISEEQLKTHHQKHHKSYVDNTNRILERLEEERKRGIDSDMKSVLKNLSFNIGGHILHSLFWKNLSPTGNSGEFSEALIEKIKLDFGSFERFRKEFSNAALSVEGSGWAALSYCKTTERLLITQIEKHNTNLYPGFPIMLVLDVWEHAYYIDYRNDRKEFIEKFWKIINWNEINRRFHKAFDEDRLKAFPSGVQKA